VEASAADYGVSVGAAGGFAETVGRVAIRREAVDNG